jgi:hypothetical protein
MPLYNCKKCGRKMNLTKRSHADYCYDCTYPEKEENMSREEILTLHEDQQFIPFKQPNWFGLKRRVK